ncbi:hypothetical protein DM02DRAFT_648181 [Periconia macrospinosa]|uniref:Uncharacterized protein n=1 Tax=Periconia macrospinosa TaxID=97972 RepID=A0A2V1EC47_9PLEO|nr:hypothetical protein DM02DRAFT_648181 [Periconia macrospinosa]
MVPQFLLFVLTAVATVQAQGNSVCAHWCKANFAKPGSVCTDPASQSKGPCYDCGPLKTNQAAQLCAGACVDTNTDNKNCGVCGNAFTSWLVETGGTSVPIQKVVDLATSIPSLHGVALNIPNFRKWRTSLEVAIENESQMDSSSSPPKSFSAATASSSAPISSTQTNTIHLLQSLSMGTLAKKDLADASVALADASVALAEATALSVPPPKAMVKNPNTYCRQTGYPWYTDVDFHDFVLANSSNPASGSSASPEKIDNRDEELPEEMMMQKLDDLLKNGHLRSQESRDSDQEALLHFAKHPPGKFEGLD